MHALSGKRALIGALSLALAVLTMAPNTASAGPEPGAKRPTTGKYRLFAGNLGATTVNRLYYGLNTKGEVGVDSTNSSTIGGGFWPKGTGNQYMFNSGLQVAGIIQGTKPNNPWAGDTTGGMFFDASGLRQHGTAVTELFNSTSPVDQANWPQAAFVPQGDFSEEIYDPLLRGRLAASQGDVWFLSWEGDPGLNAVRPHPLGVLAEYRTLAWNFPSGNEDILYLVITFYNVTTTNPAAYAAYRPGLRETLIEYANQFHELNNAQFNVTLPAEGYTIDPFYAAFSADPDVTNSAGVNYSSVNLPFAMGYAYHADFPRAAGWTFSPTIFGAPFFAGSGFVGMKYLKSPTGAGEIQLYSNTTNGGAFPDPNSAVRLYKYLSGTIRPEDGVSCNQGDPLESKICFVTQGNPADVRLLQSSTGLALPAGAAGSIVIAYVHAAPVQVPGYVGGTRVGPGDPLRLSDVTALSQGANLVDSIAGFRGFEDANQDGIVEQDEIQVVPGSLYGKSLTAQTIFEAKFLLPFAPDAPDFFLIPGNGQVTVLWRPSAAETTGDPYFEVASQATTIPSGGGAPVTNLLYDPNYRRFDVEGYRIYRGRADTPTSLKLVAQYDYSGTTFRDYRGQVVSDAIGSRCAPELGLTTSCNNFFSPVVPGQAATLFRSYDLNGNLVQVRAGDRTLLATGDVINLVTDTAVTGGDTGFPALSNTGVPFVFVDQEVRNGLTYFYAVTAFDINSVTSTGAGNTALESARITKRVIPRAPAGNYVNTAITESGIFGRNGRLTDQTPPSIDPATGRFSKKALPANGIEVSLAAFVAEVLVGEGEVAYSVDSIIPVSFAAASSATLDYYLSLDTPLGTTKLTQRRVQSGTNASGSTNGSFPAIEADADLAAKFGAPTGGAYGIGGAFSASWPGGYYQQVNPRGCVNRVAGFSPSTVACAYNGSRWYAGENETAAHPNGSNPNRWATGRARESFSNSGELPGVKTIFQARSYDDYTSAWRDVEAIFSAFASAGDFRVYWGENGKVDSVIDLTHDVPVPFSPKLGPTWGILNSSATQTAGYQDQRLEITASDIGCVEPIRSLNPAGLNCTAPAAQLSETAVPYPTAFGTAPSGAVSTTGNYTAQRTTPAQDPGFIFYLKGNSFVIELDGGQLPAAGTEWTMRSYVGAIAGGTGRERDDSAPYVFTTQNQPRPFNVLGARAGFRYDVTNEVVASTKESLAKVHTVPDPYYVTSAFEATTTNKQIKFVNLPERSTIRIYSVSGILVRVLKAESTSFSGEVTWDVRNRNNQFVASGVYFYHVTAENGESTVGRMTIVNYAN
jgi:hypothetical protein